MVLQTKICGLVYNLPTGKEESVYHSNDSLWFEYLEKKTIAFSD